VLVTDQTFQLICLHNEIYKCLLSFGAESYGWLAKNLNSKLHRNIILPVVLYGCDTWSLTLREEPRPRVFKYRVLRRIFGRKWNNVTGEWRNLHKEERTDLYSSPNIVRVIKSRIMKWAGHVARMGRGEA
jgi:hypothetical protein